MNQTLEEELSTLLESYGIKSCHVLFSEYGIDIENVTYVDGMDDDIEEEEF